VLLTLANKLAYHSAAWLRLTGVRHVLWVDLVWLLANLGTFLVRFALLQFVLFADHSKKVSGKKISGKKISGKRVQGKKRSGRPLSAS
jgi:hypothetical protein